MAHNDESVLPLSGGELSPTRQTLEELSTPRWRRGRSFGPSDVRDESILRGIAVNQPAAEPSLHTHDSFESSADTSAIKSQTMPNALRRSASFKRDSVRSVRDLFAATTTGVRSSQLSILPPASSLRPIDPLRDTPGAWRRSSVRMPTNPQLQLRNGNGPRDSSKWDTAYSLLRRLGLETSVPKLQQDSSEDVSGTDLETESALQPRESSELRNRFNSSLHRSSLLRTQFTTDEERDINLVDEQGVAENAIRGTGVLYDGPGVEMSRLGSTQEFEFSPPHSPNNSEPSSPTLSESDGRSQSTTPEKQPPTLPVRPLALPLRLQRLVTVEETDETRSGATTQRTARDIQIQIGSPRDDLSNRNSIHPLMSGLNRLDEEPPRTDFADELEKVKAKLQGLAATKPLKQEYATVVINPNHEIRTVEHFHGRRNSLPGPVDDSLRQKVQTADEVEPEPVSIISSGRTSSLRKFLSEAGPRKARLEVLGDEPALPELENANAPKRLLEIPFTDEPDVQPSYEELFVDIFKYTHRLVSLFFPPMDGLNRVARVTLLYTMLVVQLVGCGVVYNTLVDSEMCQDMLCSNDSYFTWSHAAVGICVSAVSMPVAAFLLFLLSSPPKRFSVVVPFDGDIEAAKIQKRTYRSSVRHMLGFLLCGILILIGHLIIAGPLHPHQADDKLTKKWMGSTVISFAADLIGIDLFRIYLHSFLLLWFAKPAGSLGDSDLKKRIFMFWCGYVVFLGVSLQLLYFKDQIYNYVIGYIEKLSPLIIFIVFFIVASLSNLMLLFMMLVFRPPKFDHKSNDWNRLVELHYQHKHRVALLITAHLSADVIQATLEAALHVFTPSQIFVCDNGRCTNPLDLWECTDETCSAGNEGTRYFSSEKQVDSHSVRFPSHRVRGYAQGKTAWVCEQVSSNWNRGEYEQGGLEGRPESINYIWVPEGSKIMALWYVSRHYCGVTGQFDFICQLDDDVLIPSDWILPFSSFESDRNTMSVVIPLHGIDFTNLNQSHMASCQNLEYRTIGYVKWVQSQLGTTLFCHGAASFWRREAFNQVLDRHDTMHQGDDVQMGLVLHGVRGDLLVDGLNGGYAIDTAWHCAMSTQVPVCWFHEHDFKLLFHRLLLGMSAGFLDSIIANWFKKWRPTPCSCGEPSLFFQRALGWDTTEHRFLFQYARLLLKSVSNCQRHDWLLFFFASSQFYTVLIDLVRPVLLPLVFAYGGWYWVILGVFISTGTTWLVEIIFCLWILRDRYDVLPPFRSLLVFPLYKLVCVMLFRTVAIIYNLLWYLPFNKNKAPICTRTFACDCDKMRCSARRYKPPFFYYSRTSHVPPGPNDSLAFWKNCHLAQWHVVDRMIARALQVKILKRQIKEKKRNDESKKRQRNNERRRKRQESMLVSPRSYAGSDPGSPVNLSKNLNGNAPIRSHRLSMSRFQMIKSTNLKFDGV
eukprot:GILK01010612.1.p1 GENE.GILK01010612.1~~GILK01010612.1.p1  ORF type:complete len:1545 (-),score=261.70 GILK01010612.1:88-4389(-)